MCAVVLLDITNKKTYCVTYDVEGEMSSAAALSPQCFAGSTPVNVSLV